MQHNHFTRDIKHYGECPACDRTMAIGGAMTVIENFLYEHNVDHEECSSEAAHLLKKLNDVGLTVTWKEEK